MASEHTFLWLLKQSENRWYDTYDSCIVAAMTEKEAKEISPSGKFGTRSRWAFSPDSVTAEKIGVTQKHREGQVILGSYNAG